MERDSRVKILHVCGGAGNGWEGGVRPLDKRASSSW